MCRQFLAAVMAVLLLAQWGGSASVCLAALRTASPGALCHVDGGQPPDPQPGRHDPACAHCVPLPPTLAASPPVLPPPGRAIYAAALAAVQARLSAPPAASPFQPRGPPTLA